jgi:3-hydroxyacyl-[acyl-carrier-protein] dehydratase
VGADEVRLRRRVVPGDQLRLEAEVITNRRGIYKFAAKASVEDEVVGTMVIMCAERQVDVD